MFSMNLWFSLEVARYWLGGGGACRKIVWLIFQPTRFIIYLLWSVWKIMEKKKFLLFNYMEMVAILVFSALTKVHINTASSNAVKSCTLVEDISYKSVFSFVE